MSAPHRRPVTLSLSPSHPGRCHWAPPRPGPACQPCSPASPMATTLPCSRGNGAAPAQRSRAVANRPALPTAAPAPPPLSSFSLLHADAPAGPLLLFLLPYATESPSKQTPTVGPCPFYTPLSSHLRPTMSLPPPCSLDLAYPPRTPEPIAPLRFPPRHCCHSPSR
jgi:hypothetical protein